MTVGEERGISGEFYFGSVAVKLQRTLRRRGGYADHRGADAGRQGAPERHFALLGPIIPPSIILGGIYSGMLTATESAAIAVV